jgi:hypothetical protein
VTAQPKLTDDEIFLNALDANDRDTRIDVSADALLHRAGKQHEHMFIENLSIHGVQATCDFPPLVGEAIEIELAGLGRFQGVVRWQRQNNFGVHTFESIDLSLFR